MLKLPILILMTMCAKLYCFNFKVGVTFILKFDLNAVKNTQAHTYARVHSKQYTSKGRKIEGENRWMLELVRC